MNYWSIFRRWMYTSVALCATGLALPSTLQAATLSESISTGSNWLLDARRGWAIWASDTILPAEPMEITVSDLRSTYVRDSLESISALQSVGKPVTDYQPALNWVHGIDAPFCDTAANRIKAIAKAGQDTSSLINEFDSYRNPDGGFAASPGYPSDVLSTAAALEALAAAGRSSDPATISGVNYLLSRQSASGGWTQGDNDPSVYLTALSFRALWSHRGSNAQIPTALTKARDFLLSQRDADGSWSEQFNTALALIALVPYLPDTSSVASSISSLQFAQLNNGSWDNDPYTTALALQALYLASLPQTNPDHATIKGKVVDAQTGLPLSGVAVTFFGNLPDDSTIDSPSRVGVDFCSNVVCRKSRQGRG